MAGSQKEFELLFKLKAALGPNFNGAFKSAINTNNQLRDSMKNVNSLQSKIDGYTKQSAAIDKNKERLALLNAEHDRLQQELQQTGEPTDALRKKLERNESQIQQTTAKIQEQERQLNSYAEELREAGVNTDNLEEANGRLQKSYEKLQSSQQTLQKINEKQQQVQQSISKTKGQLLGTIGAIGAIATAVYAGPVQAAQKYETAIAKVGTIADTQEVPLGTLSQQIMQLSNQTGIAASAVADDVYNAISAGQKTADAVNFVTNSTKLAKAGFAESSQTLDVLTTVLNAYGMSADKVGTVSDMLVQTQNKGKVTVGELASSMGKIIPTANASNVSLEQLCAGYAIMTSKGIAAAETTTYMNSMLNELSKSGSTTDKLLREKMGGSFSELMKSGKSLGEILGGIQDEASKSGLALSDMFSSSEAGKAAMSLLSNGVDGFNASVQDMVNSVGATDSAFAKMEDTTEAKMEKAKNSIANLSIVLGQNLLPIVGNMADKVATVVTKVSEFAAANPKLVQTVLKVAAGLAALKVGMLTTKLVTLSAEDGILSLAKKLVGLRAGFIENAATSAGFAAKLKAAGSGVLSYFGNVKGALGGVGSAIGNIFSGNRVIGAVTGFMGNVKASVVNGFMGLATKAGGALTGAGTKLLGLLLKPFSLVGGKLGPILGTVGTAIANSPLGKIGGLITRGITGAFSKATTLIAPLGNAVKTVLGPLGNLAKTALGPLGGIAGKILPVVGAITTIITVIKLVQTHLEEIRSFIQRTFGDEALAVFDKIVAVITNVENTIKNVFSGENIGAARDKIQELFGDKGAAVFDTFVNVLGTVKNAVSEVVGFITANVVPVAEQVLQVITTQVIPGIVSFIQAAAPTIMQIIQSVADFIGAIIPVIGSFIAGLMPIISEIITFISTYVLPIISELFSFICSTVLPAISDAIQAILPVVQNVLQTLLPAIQTALSTIWNIVSPIIQGILAAVQFVMPTIQAIVQSGVQAISGVISGIVTVLNGIITFITGVFSGNWRQAWEGIKSIFSGIWQAIKSVCTGAINGIISAVNTVIRGLNKVKVPDWVPGVGGKGINISEIPMLAKGSSNTPDTFIAGEAGPELITNAPGRTVFTASQTRSIMAAQNTAATTAAAVAPTTAPTTTAQTVNNYNTAPEVTAGAGNNGGGAKNVTINNNPTIVVSGVQAISGVISGIVTVLNGIITFITGVFSGNWRQAWEGIKSIFSGIWQAIKSVCTGAINGIISAVNTVIRGLNKVKVPDWVPGVGGKGINISEIPMLAKGSSNTPDTFIAGEAGPELITNAPGRTVFTASQTRSIMAAQNTAATTAAAVAPTTAPTTTAQTVNNYNTAPEVTAGAGNNGGGAKNVTINNNPTIVVNGDKPEDLDAKLEENNKRLLRDVEELLDEKEDKERRQKYD